MIVDDYKCANVCVVCTTKGAQERLMPAFAQQDGAKSSNVSLAVPKAEGRLGRSFSA